ncbi:hypothetical protein HY382_00255 [Candidatus Curtissbacteria bacterium]|nr:hypothetical protein [Candidatus Curtissbacteria bacterium]
MVFSVPFIEYIDAAAVTDHFLGVIYLFKFTSDRQILTTTRASALE